MQIKQNSKDNYLGDLLDEKMTGEAARLTL